MSACLCKLDSLGMRVHAECPIHGDVATANRADECEAVAARDAEWRAAANGLARKHDSACDLARGESCDCGAGAHNQTLLALLAAMEAK